MRRIPAVILVLLALLAGIVATGAAMVRTTHEARSLFRELEALRLEQDRLRGDWSALQLEVGTLAGHARIDGFARSELGMIEPGENMRYVEVRR